jgi:eukaryotic-like serine/threonine-protein kinase
MRDQLQVSLGAAYALERELGHGGMATVFLAEDLKHHRPVALKVLRPDLGAALGPERFRREIAMAATLQHPHILSVYDSGETPAGQLWFTMMYVDGASLRERLERERQLPLEEAVRITREAALALQYAHEHGVVHRDIKPENLLLTKDGSTLVADFGIARALPGSGAGETLTETGVAIGTPQYMSPEQASADRAIDARTDVYSLGAVCYEMLAGEPPFTGPTAQSIMAKMMSGEPPSVRRARPTVPAAVDGVIRKALAPVPGDRFATTAEFAKALTLALASAASTTTSSVAVVPPPVQRRTARTALLTVLAIGVVAAGTYAWRLYERSLSARAGPIRIAVLPFDNLGDSADTYFADGVTDAVRGKLTAVPGLEVIAPVSSAKYRHTTKTPQEVGHELGVQYLLTGRVRWAKAPGVASRVQVNPALIDASTAADKWDAPFDAPLTDVFQVQAGIATRVVAELEVALTPVAQRTIARQPTRNLEAYNAYLRGRALEDGNSVYDYEPAAAAYAQAVALDSSFALAWAALARAQLWGIELSPLTQVAKDAESARIAAGRAIALAPDLSEAHEAQGFYDAQILLDHAGALAEYQVGRRLNPGDATLVSLASVSEWALGRRDSSLADRERAARLDPQNATVLLVLCDGIRGVFRYADAERSCDRAMALQPRRLDIVEGRMLVSLEQGDLPGARAVMRTALAAIDSVSLATYVSEVYELGWVLDSALEGVLLREARSPGGLLSGGDWFCALAQQYGYRGDTNRARAYADSAAAIYAVEFRGLAAESPSRPLPLVNYSLSHLFYGLSLAYLGKKDSALAQAKLAENAIGERSYISYVRFTEAKIRLLLKQPNDALDLLERSVAPPDVQPADKLLEPLYTRRYLRLDRNFARLHGNPRFERLIAQPAGNAGPAP